MKYSNKTYSTTNVEVSNFNGEVTNEHHIVLTPQNKGSFDEQLSELNIVLNEAMLDNNIPKGSIVLKRYFVSDYTNQNDTLLAQEGGADYSMSVVQEPPLCGSKVLLWVYFVSDAHGGGITKTSNNTTECVVERNGYQHVWNTGLTGEPEPMNSFRQTETLFADYNNNLLSKKMTLRENCIRTWLYVRDVDVNYSGVVEARKELFNEVGMTKDTHFITSTGIEGQHFSTDVNVLMDAYAVGGIQEKQVKFLTAPDNLNPTHEYGVTFERGTSVDYGDRRHIFISGTASIDNKGEIVHVNDIFGQTKRTIENIKALLKDAEAEMNDIAKMIVYLRDFGDYEVVSNYLKENHHSIPTLIVLAPVCRPGWLIEIECIAIKKTNGNRFNNY